MKLRVAIAGAGAWGTNILRVVAAREDVEIASIVDVRSIELARASRFAPSAALETSFARALADRPRAVIIATPSPTHSALALAAIEAGADVFVEKPLAMDAIEARRCRDRAVQFGRVAMVGHVLRYHPTALRLVELARSGALGELYEFESTRLSPRGDRGASALWTLAPHDVSLLHAIDPSPLAWVGARAQKDALTIDLVLESGLRASMRFSQSHPTKERIVRVEGSLGAAAFDDVRAPSSLATSGGAIAAEWVEPLAAELDHFFSCVASREAPRTSFEEGARVVETIARAEDALERGSARTSIARS